ncbi:MAG: NAD(+)/NADH kinase, partial [Acidobacteria bacterium]|nr:NAD(+)/NADH kinase [Acidobacteriota bacterium]
MIKGSPVKRCAILADPRNSEMAVTLDQARDEVQKHLDDLGIISEVFFGIPPQEIHPHPDTDIFLVLGGDGTMIFFAGPLSHLEIPFFGINYGNVGFMMNSIKHGLLNPLKKLHEGHFSCWDFPLLEVDAHDHSGQVHHGLGLNDIYLQRMTVQTCKINVSI